jgi:outer membrane protein TolC
MAFEAEWNAGLLLSYPLFTGGAVRSAVARADAVERGATEQLRLARNQLAEEIDRALSALDESRARVRSLTAAVGQLTEVVRIEKLSLEAGSGTQTDYLRTEADLLSAQAGLVEARHTEIAARAELARVTGQLNSGWIAQSLENQQ